MNERELLDAIGMVSDETIAKTGIKTVLDVNHTAKSAVAKAPIDMLKKNVVGINISAIKKANPTHKQNCQIVMPILLR